MQLENDALGDDGWRPINPDIKKSDPPKPEPLPFGPKQDVESEFGPVYIE